MSRFQELKDSVRHRLLTAVRQHLFAHLDTKISRYEKELERNRKLLDVVSERDSTRRRPACPADIQQIAVTKEEVPMEQQDWSTSLNQVGPGPSHIKEEPKEVSVCLTETDGDCGRSESYMNNVTNSQQEMNNKASDEPESDNSDKNGDGDNGRFHCSECGKTCSQRGNLTTHMRTHTGEKPFSCSVCGKRFTQKVGLHYHLKIHTGEKPFSCSVCGKTFRQKRPLNCHMLTHTGLKPFSCSVCNKRFRWSSQIRLHKCAAGAPQHRRTKTLRCSECGESFQNNSLLMMHKTMHKGKKLFTCSVCGLQRQFSSQMEIHMRIHTGERPYSCTICGKRFTQRGIMMQHMAIHSGVKPFGCSECGRRFFWHFQIKKHKCAAKSPQNMLGFTTVDFEQPGTDRYFGSGRHLNLFSYRKTSVSNGTDDSIDIDFWKDIRQHQSGLTYQRKRKVSVDDGCGKKIYSDSEDKIKTQSKDRRLSVSDSQNEDTSTSDAGFNTNRKTPWCSVSCHTPEDRHTLPIRRDMKCHTAEKPFSCFYCGKKFATGGFLTRHLSVHTGEKPVSCVLCGKRFSLESECKNHQCDSSFSWHHQSESEERRLFSWSQSSKGFSRKQHLQLHMEMNIGEKPYCCSLCGDRFVKRENLSFHLRCHTRDESLLRCSVCKTSFSDRDSLVQHMRIHTRQTQFSCSVCGKEFAWRRYLTKHMDIHARKGLNFESLQLYQSQTEEESGEAVAEQMETEAGGDDIRPAEPGPVRNSDSNGHLQPGPDEKTVTESETDDNFVWRENSQTGSTSVKEEVCGSEIGSETETASESFNRHSDDSVDSDFWKESRKPQSSAKNSDPDRHSESSGPETDDSDFWKENRQRKSVVNSVTGDETDESHDSGKKVSESVEADSDNSVDSDFWKESRKPQSGSDSVKNNVSESDTRFNCLRKPYSCSECGKCFLDVSDLKTHMMQHKAERPFLCSVCGQKCLYRSHLQIHMRTHTGEKPFICPICGKKYAHKASMQSHMVIHTVETQYNCSACNRGFAWYTELKYHQCAGESHENQFCGKGM